MAFFSDTPAKARQQSSDSPMMAAGHSTLQEHFAELMSNSAGAAILAGRYAEAEEQLRRVIQLQQRALGPEHEDTLDSQGLHAFALNGMGRYDEAAVILREVLQVKQQSPRFGMENESTLSSVLDLGRCLLKQGRFKEAEPMLRKVHALDVRVLGPRHLETLNMQRALGNCLVGDNQLEEAEGLLRDALEGLQAMEATTERSRVAAGLALHDLGLCLRQAGKYVEAESLLRAVVKYARHRLGEASPLTVNCMAQHACVLTAMAKHAAAEVMYRLAVQGSGAAYGPESVDATSIACKYAECLVVQQKWAPAETLLRDTLSHLQQALGEDHPRVLKWMRVLALFLQSQDQGSKRNEAKALLRRARELARNRQG